MSDQYHYRELSSAHCTRVLHLYPAANLSEPLECDLEERSLNDENQVDGAPFAALSYTWGTSGTDHFITCEGRKISITKNCDAALRRLREKAARESSILWVDAICIDQSNIEERSQQVEIFAEIYFSADRTWIWLGEIRETTNFALGLLVLLHNLLRDINPLHSIIPVPAKELLSRFRGLVTDIAGI
jgi:hypothetical protein